MRACVTCKHNNGVAVVGNKDEPCYSCLTAGDSLPNYEAIDEPEKRVGHWRKANDRPRSWVYICSECGETAYFPNPKHFHSCGYKYCPNCGVPMDANPK